MTEMLSVNKRDMDRRHFLRIAGASIAAAAIPAVPAVAEETVNLVLWSWLPNFQAQLDLFEAAHPNIKVKLINAGQGPEEYTNLRAGLKAGSGLPDVCHVEFQMVRSFKQLNALADIGKSANAHKSEFADGAGIKSATATRSTPCHGTAARLECSIATTSLRSIGPHFRRPGTSLRNRRSSSTRPRRTST